jgi:predicted  nucleic acid-binding Zn-ribbon protein
MMDHLPDVIKALQNLQDNQSAILAIGETKDKVEAELKASQTKLDEIRAELKSETSGLTNAQIETKRNYERQLNDTQMHLSALQKQVDAASAKLTELQGEIRDKQAQHDAVVRGLNALRDRIEGRAA